jgi:hypothetical protein
MPLFPQQDAPLFMKSVTHVTAFPFLCYQFLQEVVGLLRSGWPRLL